MKPEGEKQEPHLLAHVLPCAFAMALGWGVRGQYGGEKGAALAGAILALALCLVTRDKAKERRAPWILAAGLAFAFGGMMSYGAITCYVAHPERGVTFQSDWPMLARPWGVWLWGLIGLAIVGGIWGWLGATALGVAVSERKYGARDLGAIAAIAVAGGIVGHLGLIRWLGITTSHRSDFWATLLGATVGFYWWTAAARRDRAARVLGVCGLVGFGLGFPLLQQLHVLLAPHFPLRCYDWWKIVEQGLGFVGGGAIAAGLWRLDRTGHRTATPGKSRPLLERSVWTAAIWLVIFWNGRNNFEYWCAERAILPGWALTAWDVAGTAAAVVLAVRVAAVGKFPIGRREVVRGYLVLVWFAVIGSGLKMAFPYSGIGWVGVQVGFTLMAVGLTAHALGAVGRRPPGDSATAARG